MNGSIVIGMEAAGRTQQGLAPAQPCATRDSAQIKFTEHVGQGVFALSAICAGDGACVRAIGILGSLETETVAPQIQWPAPNFQSALGTAFADTGVLSHALMARLRFKFFGAFTALQAVFPRLHSALRVLQDFACNGAKSFQVLSLSARVMGLAAGVYGQHTDRRKMKCPTKALKDSTK